MTQPPGGPTTPTIPTTGVEPSPIGRSTDGAPGRPGLPGRATSGPAFIALLSMIMALAAVGIDMMLPAFDDIRVTFDLGAGSNEVARVVTAYFLGMALAPIPYGALSDRWGRRPVLWLSGSVYILGATISALAPTFGLLLLGRFVWGLGAAGGRVVAFAILRDTHQGDRMAQMMSYMMAVFILVPILAPSLGALIVRFGPWQAVFGAGAAAGAAVLLWSLRLPETLTAENRRTDLFATVPSTARRMAATASIAGPVVSLTAVMAVMSTFLASSELIIGDLFGWGDRFPLVFGANAAVLGVASLVNGRLLRRLRIEQLTRPLAGAYLAFGVAALVVTLLADGRPGFWLFMPFLTAAMACQMFLMPAFNTLALAPMADAAGTASALIATVTTAVGASIGAVVDTQFHDTVTPLPVALTAAGAVVVVLVTATIRGERPESPSP